MSAPTTTKRKGRRKAPADEPPPSAPRYEGETWRPNAPGWPAQPRIPRRAEEG